MCENVNGIYFNIEFTLHINWQYRHDLTYLVLPALWHKWLLYHFFICEFRPLFLLLFYICLRFVFVFAHLIFRKQQPGDGDGEKKAVNHITKKKNCFNIDENVLCKRIK